MLSAFERTLLGRLLAHERLLEAFAADARMRVYLAGIAAAYRAELIRRVEAPPAGALRSARRAGYSGPSSLPAGARDCSINEAAQQDHCRGAA